MKKLPILGVKVCYSNYDYFVDRIINAAKKNRSLKVAPVASHPVTEALFDKNLKKALNSFDMVLPDGRSLVWAANKLFKAGIKDRIYGPELMEKLALKSEKSRTKILLYGNHVEKTKRALIKKYKKLDVIALEDLKLRKLGQRDIDDLIARSKKYKNSMLFIGIGSPAQHLLLEKLEGVRMPIIAFGAAFDFISGIKKQAPGWMGDVGLEWFFRLTTEPLRLWRRYLVLAPIFVLFINLQKIRGRT